MAYLVELAEKLTPGSSVDHFEERFNFLYDIVEIHAQAEDDLLYPDLDELREDITLSFMLEHDLDKDYFQLIKQSIERIKENGTGTCLDDLKRTVRGLQALLNAHIQKEEDLLFPLADQELNPEVHAELVGKLVAYIPPRLLDRMLKWIVGFLTLDEQADFIGLLLKGAPSSFVVKDWIKQIFAEDEWRDLADRLLESDPGRNPWS